MRVRRAAALLLRASGVLLAILIVMAVAALIILPSEWFRNKVKTRIIAEVERASGGRAEIGAFQFEWSSLTAEVAPLILHGTEGAGETPLFRAESVKVGLKITSVFRRDIDIASLQVNQPRVNVLVDSNGGTNIPKPKIPRSSDKGSVEQLLDLAVNEISLRNGEMHYGNQSMPLDVRARYLNAKLLYDFRSPAYEVTASVQELSTTGPASTTAANLNLETTFRLLKDKVDIHHARLGLRESSVELAGIIDNLSNPSASADVTLNGSLAELGPLLKLPGSHTGSVNFRGQVQYDPVNRIRMNGRLTAQHLELRQDRIAIRNVAVASNVHLANRELKLQDLTVHALDGIFRGAVGVRDVKDFEVTGEVSGVSVGSLLTGVQIARNDLSGSVAGPVKIRGSLAGNARDLKAEGRLTISAKQGGVPVNGSLAVAFDRRRNMIQLGDSFIALPSSRLTFNGTAGEVLQVRFESHNLRDLEPMLALASDIRQQELPVRLSPGGIGVFEGSLTGPLSSARVQGRLTLSDFNVRDQHVDSFTADLAATSATLHVSTFTLAQETLRLAGSGDAGLRGWKPGDTSPINAKLRLEGADLAKLLRQAGQTLPVEGVLSAQADITGTAGAPEAALDLTADKPVLYREPFERLTAKVRYRRGTIEVVDGLAVAGRNNRVSISGTYTHPPQDVRNGQARFTVGTEGWRLEEVRTLTAARPGFAGRVRVKATGTVAVKNGVPFPQNLNGTIALRNVGMDQRPLGDLTLDVTTSGEQLSFVTRGNFRGSRVTGNGQFRLAGDYPGSGEVAFSQIALSTVRDFVEAARGNPAMTIEGQTEGKLVFSGPARQPSQMRVRAELTDFRLQPPRQSLNARQRAELSLRNDGPVVLEYDGKALQIRSAHLTGGDTDLQASGQVAFTDRAPVDIKVNGNLNLAVLQDFHSDLTAGGVAVINTSVRGTVQNPQMSGRMELRNASLYISDVPNGLDNLNGTVIFDQRRATIEKMRATTGSGDLLMSGFIGFAGNELNYQLQARADRVRIRYPEGVSTSANATLSLTGTSSRSLLSGVVTVLRSGFNPRTDVGRLLAAAPTPVAGPGAQSEFLRSMALDVRVETVPNLQFQTSLTSDLQADADLRVRGTAAKPIVLGRIVVSQGEIQFFGNKYTINRGEIGFFNPVRLEPTLDLSLETQARGVQVTINFNGTLQKLNVSYRSDPPLQSNEIIALLAVGRAPGTNSSLASSQTVSSSNVMTTGTNSLLGQAVATPVSNRLQRFFGVSKLKIDPQLTGLSAIPQARLTIEQQISRDVTLTYVTNLSQANQQIIRLEWNLSKAWSVVAVREENGVFGVDFFFKKRFR